MNSVKERLLKIISDLIKNENVNYNKSISEITEELTMDDLQLDSISFIKLVVAIEIEFDVEFEDVMLEYNNINKIKNLVKIIENKVS